MKLPMVLTFLFFSASCSVLSSSGEDDSEKAAPGTQPVPDIIPSENIWTAASTSVQISRVENTEITVKYSQNDLNIEQLAELSSWKQSHGPDNTDCHLIDPLNIGYKVQIAYEDNSSKTFIADNILCASMKLYDGYISAEKIKKFLSYKVVIPGHGVDISSAVYNDSHNESILIDLNFGGCDADGHFFDLYFDDNDSDGEQCSFKVLHLTNQNQECEALFFKKLSFNIDPPSNNSQNCIIANGTEDSISIEAFAGSEEN